MFIVKENKYIEIKGVFWNKKSTKKWEYFHNENKNSEIWFYEDIKKITNKTKREMILEFKEQYDKEKNK